jgi:hypothetical protein
VEETEEALRWKKIIIYILASPLLSAFTRASLKVSAMVSRGNSQSKHSVFHSICLFIHDCPIFN